jgi:hypothetical protein
VEYWILGKILEHILIPWKHLCPTLQVISAGIDNTVKIWDMRKAALETTIKGHTDTVTGTIPIVRYG